MKKRNARKGGIKGYAMGGFVSAGGAFKSTNPLAPTKPGVNKPAVAPTAPVAATTKTAAPVAPASTLAATASAAPSKEQFGLQDIYGTGLPEPQARAAAGGLPKNGTAYIWRDGSVHDTPETVVPTTATENPLPAGTGGPAPSAGGSTASGSPLSSGGNAPAGFPNPSATPNPATPAPGTPMVGDGFSPQNPAGQVPLPNGNVTNPNSPMQAHQVGWGWQGSNNYTARFAPQAQGYITRMYYSLSPQQRQQVDPFNTIASLEQLTGVKFDPNDPMWMNEGGRVTKRDRFIDEQVEGVKPVAKPAETKAPETKAELSPEEKALLEKYRRKTFMEKVRGMIGLAKGGRAAARGLNPQPLQVPNSEAIWGRLPPGLGMRQMGPSMLPPDMRPQQPLNPQPYQVPPAQPNITGTLFPPNPALDTRPNNGATFGPTPPTNPGTTGGGYTKPSLDIPAYNPSMDLIAFGGGYGKPPASGMGLGNQGGYPAGGFGSPMISGNFAGNYGTPVDPYSFGPSGAGSGMGSNPRDPLSGPLNYGITNGGGGKPPASGPDFGPFAPFPVNPREITQGAPDFGPFPPRGTAPSANMAFARPPQPDFGPINPNGKGPGDLIAPIYQGPPPTDDEARRMFGDTGNLIAFGGGAGGRRVNPSEPDFMRPINPDTGAPHPERDAYGNPYGTMYAGGNPNFDFTGGGNAPSLGMAPANPPSRNITDILFPRNPVLGGRDSNGADFGPFPPNGPIGNPPQPILTSPRGRAGANARHQRRARMGGIAKTMPQEDVPAGFADGGEVGRYLETPWGRYDRQTGWAEWRDEQGNYTPFETGDRRDPRLYGRYGATPDPSSESIGDNPYYERAYHAADEASGVESGYWRLNDAGRQYLESRGLSTIGQLGQGGWSEVSDPSQVVWDENFGLLTKPTNIREEDPARRNRARLVRGLILAAGAAGMGGFLPGTEGGLAAALSGEGAAGLSEIASEMGFEMPEIPGLEDLGVNPAADMTASANEFATQLAQNASAVPGGMDRLLQWVTANPMTAARMGMTVASLAGAGRGSGGSGSSSYSPGGGGTYTPGGGGTYTPGGGGTTGGTPGGGNAITALSSLSDEELARYRRYFPLEDQMLEEATNAGSAAMQEERAAAAADDVANQFNRQRGMTRRSLAAGGVNPDSVQGAALMGEMGNTEAANRAAAMNQARREERDLGFNRRAAMMGLGTQHRTAGAGLAESQRNFDERRRESDRNFDLNVFRVNNGLDRQRQQDRRQNLSDFGSGIRTGFDIWNNGGREAVSGIVDGVRDAWNGVTDWLGSFKDGGKARLRGVKPFMAGGEVSGPGDGTVDTVPAMLADGEMVVNAEGTALMDKVAPGLLEEINKRGLQIRKMRDGGRAAAKKGAC